MIRPLINSLINHWGTKIQWERSNFCPFVSVKSQACSTKPVINCPICGGIGVVYDPPLTVMGIFRNMMVPVTVQAFGLTMQSVPTLLISPKEVDAIGFLTEGVFRTNTDKVELKDRFTVRDVLYVADGPATPPYLADEILAWRIPLKRVWKGPGSQG